MQDKRLRRVRGAAEIEISDSGIEIGATDLDITLPAATPEANILTVIGI